MRNADSKQLWEQYKERELARVVPLLAALGFELERDQPHISGERYLMQAITTASGRKLILLGRHVGDNKRVVIKATSDPAGMHELMRERTCRKVLQKINFAYDVFLSPREIRFTKRDGCLISIQEFLKQERPFLERTLEEQFSLALKAFKAQESAHATTYRHLRLIKKTFGYLDARGYLQMFESFSSEILARSSAADLPAVLKEAARFLADNIGIIEQYSGFLTHIDFVPHNFRIVENNIYLLDHSSLRFGNKYEGWARFLNFMALYNPPLTAALTQYVRDNRATEESLSLKLMRVYRLGEIIRYYSGTLNKTSGALHKLSQVRIEFWTRMLEALHTDTVFPPERIETYKRTRDALRSEEEKHRQMGLH